MTNFKRKSLYFSKHFRLSPAVLLGIAIIVFVSILETSGVRAATGDILTRDPFTASTSASGATTILSAAINPVFSTPKTRKIWITAYSSTPEETDDTPFITASGKLVHEGIVATNILPLGTRIKIPALYGEKIFVVEDRMHPRKRNNVDIWMPTTRSAVLFGAVFTDIVILEQKPELLSKK